jgi:hypothetical protein
MRHNTRRIALSLAALAVVGVLACHAQGNNDSKVIARFGDHVTITFADLRKYVRDFSYAYEYRNRQAEGYQKALDDMIANKLKRFEFFGLGMDKDSASIRQVRRPINEELVIRYYTRQYYHKYVNEQSVQNVYKDMGKVVHYQQVDLTLPEKAAPGDFASLKGIARKIRARALKGEDLDQAASSELHTAKSASQKTLQTVDWKVSLMDSLQYLIFHLPANDVRIFEGRGVFHVVKVVKISGVEVPPFEIARPDIEKALDTRYIDVSEEEFERDKKKLLDTNKVKWMKPGLQQLVRWSNVAQFYRTGYRDTLANAVAHGRNFVIMRYPGGRLDCEELRRLLDDVLTPAEFASIAEDNVKRFLLEAVRTDIVVKKALALGLQDNVFNAQTESPVLKDNIVKLYNRHEIEAKIPPATDQALREFYRANKDSLYYQFAKVNLYVILDSNQQTLQEMRKKLDQGVQFEKLAPSIAVKTYVRKRDGNYATFLGNDPPYLADAGFRLHLDEIAGPVESNDPTPGNGFALIKCMGTREEKQLSFEDVQKTIKDDFMTYHRALLEKAKREQLVAKYRVAIDHEALRLAMESVGVTPH